MGWPTNEIFTFVNPSVSPAAVQTYCTVLENYINAVTEDGNSVSVIDDTVFFTVGCTQPCTLISVNPDKV